MAHIIDDEIYCCTDCLMLVANDDASGMDDATEARCRAGIAAFEGYLVCNGQEEEPGFSWSGCDVCNSHLGGDRHRLAMLGDGGEAEVSDAAR